MGVMACDRTECENVMYERLILDGRMYICSDCYAELLCDKKTWPVTMTALEIRERIENFMRSRPGRYQVLSGEDLDNEFNRLMGSERYGDQT